MEASIPVNDSPSTSDSDAVIPRWLDALLQVDPNLPRPVASAMVQNVARGSVGEPLRHLDQAILALEAVPPAELTGSETRTVLAILTQLEGRIAHLKANLLELWHPPTR